MLLRLMLIVCGAILASAAPATAQYALPDSLNLAAFDTARTVTPLPVSYPVARHTLYGTAAGASILGSVMGVVSVLCSAPVCPRMGPAITYGALFGAIAGAAVGAVTGMNSPAFPTTVAKK